jgi:hypothetical protein
MKNKLAAILTHRAFPIALDLIADAITLFLVLRWAYGDLDDE